MLRAAHADGVPLGEAVVADADYGRVTAFRTAITDLGLHYAVAVQGEHHVWLDGRVQIVRDVAAAVRPRHWKRVTWRADHPAPRGVLPRGARGHRRAPRSDGAERRPRPRADARRRVRGISRPRCARSGAAGGDSAGSSGLNSWPPALTGA
jgi:hypothetical protein